MISIADIEKQLGEDPIFYLKFTSELKYANDFVKGQIYANTPEYFREKEEQTQIRGQGDKNELMYNMPLFDIKFFDPKTNECCLTIEKASGTVTRKADDDIPMVCFVGIPLRQMKIISQDENNIYLGFPFSDDEYDTMQEQFGKYCMIISASSLMDRLKELNEEKGILFKAIKYVVPNSQDKAMAHFQGTLDRFFYKDDDLDYQREYRLVIFDKMPEDHIFKVKPFSKCIDGHGDVKIVECEALRNLGLSINLREKIL